MDDSPLTPDSSSDSMFDHVGSHDHGTAISDQADTHHRHITGLDGPDPILPPGNDNRAPSRNKRGDGSKPGMAFTIVFTVLFALVLFLVFRFL